MRSLRLINSYMLTTPREVLSDVVDDAVGADQATISRFLVLHTPVTPSLAETETLDGASHSHSYGASENGGYLSVTSTKA